jgi:GT2 family glycosyltransferase
MNLYTSIPFSPDKNLVKAYNDEVKRVPKDNDFLILKDHDAHFTTYYWYNQIFDYIKRYPECRFFTGVTNRINETNMHQKASLRITGDDFKQHWRIGGETYIAFRNQIIDYSVPKPCHLSGFLMVIQKKLWKEIGGFKPWDEQSNILGVDSRMHQDLFEAGKKVYVMKAVYMYHVYRFGNLWDKSHLV